LYTTEIKNSTPTPFSSIKLLIGLGNPGKAYEHTYHNVGRLFVDYRLKNLSSKYASNELKFRKPTASKNFECLKIGGVAFARPLLFMNESGTAVQAALKFFNVKPEELLIVHDDGDIELGNYKISFGRGAGGHHGAESVIQKLNAKDFWRLRIGIRPKESRVKSPFFVKTSAGRQGSRKKASEFVLKKISRTDEKILYSTFKDIESELSITSTQSLS